MSFRSTSLPVNIFSSRLQRWYDSRQGLLLVVMLLVTLVVYGNTFLNQWTYDDVPVIVNNPDAHTLSGFLENQRPGRPLRELSYIPEYTFFGSRPAGYHVQQLFWHWGCGSLLFVLLSFLGQRPLYAALASIFFLVHPLQAETVANISHRKELLALFFSLASVVMFIRSFRASGSQCLLYRLGTSGCYLLALLANQTALLLPLLLPLYELLFVEREARFLLKRPMYFVLLSAAAGLWFVWHYRWLLDPDLLLKIYSKNSFVASKSYYPLWMADLKAFLFYLYKIVVPVNLAPEYNIRFSSALFQPWAWAGATVLAGLLWYALRVRVAMPQVAFGIGWFLVMYLPISNILPISYILADRYMYLCLPGVAIMAGFFLQQAGSLRLTAVCCVVLALLSVMTILQNSYWRDEHTLWRHAVKVNPDSTWVQETVALSYLITGDFDRARWHARESLRLNRYNVRAYLTLAKSEDRIGNLYAALDNYKKFVSFGAFEYSQEVGAVAQYIPFLEKRIARGVSNAVERPAGKE